MSSKEIQRYADVAMYAAEEMPFDVNEAGPKVTLLAMPTDPLGQIAAMSMMYEGKVVRNLADLSDDERRHYFEQIKKTHLKAPFESVQFHFLIEGVTRSFTHQMVRQRTACYAQESLRFAVKETIDDEVALPPSLRGLADDDPRILVWRKAINGVDDAYSALVAAGVPAEDARGLLPHNITTRLHYVTNLRGLLEHGGNRLCTQAQFEWRTVFVRIVEAIRNYEPFVPDWDQHGLESLKWQYETLADMFRPICYLTGKCEFNASFDRACSIRDRVNANASIGRKSDQWNLKHADEIFIEPIMPHEWLMLHDSARVAPDA